MHTVVIRKDLKMRRGKMAAQASHALMKAVLNAFNAPYGDSVFILDSELERQIVQFQRNPEVSVKIVDDLPSLEEAELEHGNNVFRVEDIGRTEFHGVKTLTCSCLVDRNWGLAASPFAPAPFNEPIRAKQDIVVRRDINMRKEQK
jgi:PTH2 family peptidyl-tRNA hydrolase